MHQAAKISGFSFRRLRYYERKGLIVPPLRTSGGHRRYDLEDIIDLIRVKRLTDGLGLSLEQVKVVMADSTGDSTRQVIDDVKRALQRQIVTAKTRLRLAETLLNCDGAFDILPEFSELIAQISSAGDGELVKLSQALIELAAATGPVEATRAFGKV
jgi:DNA-binding transcriptional MerR regulator